MLNARERLFKRAGIGIAAAGRHIVGLAENAPGEDDLQQKVENLHRSVVLLNHAIIQQLADQLKNPLRMRLLTVFGFASLSFNHSNVR